MRNLAMWLLLSSSVAASVGCQGDDESPAKPPLVVSKPAPRRVPQVSPPIDVTAPPDDATKTASGLIYKRLVEHSAGAQVRGDETALVRYTGWRQRTGETFFTTGGDGQPIAIDVAHAAAGFREALPLLHKGEKMMLWLPSGEGRLEPVAYEIELVDVMAKPIAAAARPGHGASPPTAATAAKPPAVPAAADRRRSEN